MNKMDSFKHKLYEKLLESYNLELENQIKERDILYLNVSEL
jgi:hypothetical protein